MIDADIETFFDQIFHQWILDNFPCLVIPNLYSRNGSRVLLNIKGELDEVSALRIPLLGVIISPLITNFTLVNYKLYPGWTRKESH